MPFGCLTLGEKKDYNSPSEVSDKYDLGQVVKSWVHLHFNQFWPKTVSCMWNTTDVDFFFYREEFCEIFRAKDRNTLKMYTCKKFHKKDGRKVRKAAKNEIMILKMWVNCSVWKIVFLLRKMWWPVSCENKKETKMSCDNLHAVRKL